MTKFIPGNWVPIGLLLFLWGFYFIEKNLSITMALAVSTFGGHSEWPRPLLEAKPQGGDVGQNNHIKTPLHSVS